MSYLAPSEFTAKMIDAGESKVFMSTRDTLIRAYMAGAILALAAVFAITISVQTGNFLLGAILFPVGFCMLYLMGFDLLTGVFVLAPLALLDKRPGVTAAGVLRNWGLVFVGNFLGALTVAFLMAPLQKKWLALERLERLAIRSMVLTVGSLFLFAACCVTGWFQWALLVQ
jgi:formate/nitrite transporter FocA (FNT family)